MMNFQKIGKGVFSLFFGVCLWTQAIYGAGSPDVKVDGYNEIINVWHDTDPSTGFLKIFGSYGTASPTTAVITDPTLVHAFNPILASSHSNSATTTAVVLWKSYDLTLGNEVLQAAVADTSGWTANSAVSISDVSTETPINDYHVDISDDGTIIGINWTSYIISSGNVEVRSVNSTDGGATFSSPVTL